MNDGKNKARWALALVATVALIGTTHALGAEGRSGSDEAASGSTEILSTYVHTSDVPLQDELDFATYREQVEPIFLIDRGGNGPSQAACVTCHVLSGTPMRLQPLQEDDDGGVYWTEDQSRQNYEVVSGLVTPGAPQRSRLLREPLDTDAGGSDFHVGGKFWDSQNDPEWQAMAEWVMTADPPTGGEELASPIPDFEFFRTCVQQIFLDREEEENRMECAACHATGSRGFAQTLPDGRDFWNEEESRENFGIVMRYIEPGDPLGSRFLTHPLDPHEGGDHYHSGGRRWHSQDDPEWQMMASWVRGEPTTCAVEDR